MRVQTGLVLLLCLLACGGCGKEKSTDELIADLKSGKEKEGIIAVRTLPQGDAEKVVPALIEALRHRGNDIRRSAAIKLGGFGEQAKDAIPALQKAEEHDGDARVREAAGIALSRIDPERFPYSPKAAKVGIPTAQGRSAAQGRSGGSFSKTADSRAVGAGAQPHPDRGTGSFFAITRCAPIAMSSPLVLARHSIVSLD